MSSFSSISNSFASASRAAVARRADVVNEQQGVTAATTAAGGVSAKVDSVDFSPAALAASEAAKEIRSELRAQRLAKIKAQIASGEYDIDSKLDVVADRILKDINRPTGTGSDSAAAG
ncbi:MAG: flagellar biosynthesis anti-sigma factor FlgM [Phycisphaerales bacterium]|nr:flagellar biosynthesis anti-sigma factor FlgM [Phycisphaerales bacterium]